MDSSDPLVPGHAPVVLVVDDDELVNTLVRRWLQRERGAEVHTAYDGNTALTLAATIDVDAVFTDIELMRESGYDLFRLLRLVRPNTPICLMSSHDRTKADLENHGLDYNYFLRKPLDSGKVARTLDALLAGGPGARPSAATG